MMNFTSSQVLHFLKNPVNRPKKELVGGARERNISSLGYNSKKHVLNPVFYHSEAN